MLQLEDDRQVMLFGKSYTKKFVNQLPSGIFIKADQLIVHTTAVNQSQHQERLNKFYKNLFLNYLLPRLNQLAQQMQVTHRDVRTKNMSSRWGSCSSLGNLNFNWRLVHTKRTAIDYVVIHELAHRVHLNHSAAFWALVAKHCPNYESEQRWLKKYAIPLG